MDDASGGYDFWYYYYYYLPQNLDEPPPQQLIDLNSGEYQTVTIVPSEGSSGEMSYVLIVQQNDQDSDPHQDADVKPQTIEVRVKS